MIIRIGKYAIHHIIALKPKQNIDIKATEDSCWKGSDLMRTLTKIVGYIFLGSWALLGSYFYVKAIIDYIGK